ncbi:MAG TPA: hypothetical protein VNL94_06190, partial [Candidatus Binatia bacterium]|nr:hypothetical protein [Candidatus Binatia bacterium]
MVGRALLSRAEPGFTLPAFERIAPPPPPELIRARLEQGSAPGDVVADLFGRGGWVARAAIDRQRRAFDLESSPLTRLLAEVVLRPPDLRHLDAAFSSLAASPLGESSLRLAINELFGTRCQTCGRALPIDELEWAADRPERVHYRCVICRDQQGRHEHQAVDPTDADRDRARRDVGAATARERLLERFPLPPGGEGLAQALLDLHTDRQLVGLAAILARIEGDLRAAPVESALRLAFLHAVLPASRLGLGGSKIPALRMSGGTVRVPAAERWHERNPWLAFEDGFRMVRGFVQRLESNALGPLEARFGTDLRALGEGVSTAVVRVLTPSALRTLAEEGRGGHGPRIRLVLGQPPARFNQERLAATYHATCWVLGREAASLLPIEALLSPAVQPPWSWQSAALRRALEAAAPHLARDGRVVLLLEHGGPEALVAAVLGGVGAGYRIAEARLADPDEEAGGVVELIPPVGVLPPGPRTRANRTLEPGPGDRGDPEIVPVPGLFAPPERIEARPFSAREAAATVLETTVEVLRARGEPAHFERLLGEMLVGLDRSGALRRLLASEQGPAAAAGTGPAGADRAQALDQGDRADHPEGGWPRRESDSPRHAAGGAEAAADASGAGSPPVTRTRIFEEPQPTSDPVERVLALIRDELARPTQHRLVEVEPGRWWLGERR